MNGCSFSIWKTIGSDFFSVEYYDIYNKHLPKDSIAVPELLSSFTSPSFTKVSQPKTDSKIKKKHGLRLFSAGVLWRNKKSRRPSVRKISTSSQTTTPRNGKIEKRDRSSVTFSDNTGVFKVLPLEIIAFILTFLDRREIFDAQLLSSYFKYIIENTFKATLKRTELDEILKKTNLSPKIKERMKRDLTKDLEFALINFNIVVKTRLEKARYKYISHEEIEFHEIRLACLFSRFFQKKLNITLESLFIDALSLMFEHYRNSVLKCHSIFKENDGSFFMPRYQMDLKLFTALRGSPRLLHEELSSLIIHFKSINKQAQPIYLLLKTALNSLSPYMEDMEHDKDTGGFVIPDLK